MKYALSELHDAHSAPSAAHYVPWYRFRPFSHLPPRHTACTGHHPTRVTVVGYDFKKARFQDMHRAAVRYPAPSFSYVGTPALTPSAVDGEAAAAAAFRTDPYGCTGPLAAKRAERDPFASGGYSPDRCPAMAGLLEWCGPDLFLGRLPWAP